MVKEACFRCSRPVYPTDKVGPLKNCTYFHQGCFKCYICGTRLSLKTYCNNRNDVDDHEVYCSNHVPLAGPHDPQPHRHNLSNGDLRNGNGSPQGSVSPRPRYTNVAGVEDMRIRHALKATAIQKPYPKIIHTGAHYTLDFDTQTRLELVHRDEEDKLYNEFSNVRAVDEQKFREETKEEWERALAQLAEKYERDPQRGVRAKEELIRHLTIKRERQRETMHHRRKERERSKTAELVDKQALEMLDLFRQARQQEQENGMEENTENGGVSPVNDVSPTANGHHYPTTPPPPFPPVGRKRDVYANTSVFEVVDQTAITVAQTEEIQTFTELMHALTYNCKSDVEKARAIYRWITVKNLNLMDFASGIDPNTPMGLLRGIKMGTESYHVLFKRLCSYAGLHCVVIKGYSKSAGYQPGMHFDDGRFRNTWNAVFLNGSWRFVQCNWGARHLVNAKDAPSQRGSGGIVSSKSENLRYEYDDHYFMTDPEEFIYEFFPSQAEWQLLKRPVTLREFEELPFVRSLFFRYGLSFADVALHAVVESDSTGAATVAINMSPEAISSLIFHYNLRFYHNEVADYNGVSLKRFVMQSVVGHSVVFRVHTPCRGSFLLDIFANAVSTGEYLTGQPMKFKSVCKFKVACDHLNVIMVPLPECASGEWGPAKCYRLFGLIPLSHEDAIINSGRELEIRFRMSKPLAELVATLHNNNVDDKRLSKYLTHTMRGDQVSLRLAFPEEGQYGLDIYTRESNSQATKNGGKQLLTHCCKYLINARL